MAKYEKFEKFLKRNKKKRVIISYDWIEDIIDENLPKSAYEYNAYLSNGASHPLPKIWLELGYKQTKLVLGEYFILEKGAKND